MQQDQRKNSTNLGWSRKDILWRGDVDLWLKAYPIDIQNNNKNLHKLNENNVPLNKIPMQWQLACINYQRINYPTMLKSKYCQIEVNIHCRENIEFKNNEKEQTKVLEIEQE